MTTYVPPGVQINQLMCSDVPGDHPVVQFISVLDPLKLPPGTAVTKKSAKVKLQVKIHIVNSELHYSINLYRHSIPLVSSYHLFHLKVSVYKLNSFFKGTFTKQAVFLLVNWT